jgi:tetratricopeptide (TPR) repeat protein
MIEEDPRDPFLQYALSLELIKDREWKNAIKRLENLQSEHSNYLPLYFQLGRCYEHIEQIDKALGIYKAGSKLAGEVRDLKTKSELEEAIWELED